ncbi:HIT domain-containing protein [candidate division WWE3 bacterium]|nr:HIT domain-containing protein [candidate division WWE3 bacterium]
MKTTTKKPNDCIFCKIGKKEAPAEVIWENDKFLAFLDIFPVVPGATVVIPKTHHESYIKNVDENTTCALMEASKEVMELLDSSLEDSVGTKLIFEGLEVPHLHAKLWPMYPGVREATPEERVDPEKLREIGEKIRG